MEQERSYATPLPRRPRVRARRLTPRHYLIGFGGVAAVIFVTTGFFFLLGALVAPAPSSAKLTPIQPLIKATPAPSLPVTMRLNVPNHPQARNDGLL